MYAEELVRVQVEHANVRRLDVLLVLSRALSDFACILVHVGVIAAPALVFGSPQGRYQQRFEALQALDESLFVPYDVLQKQLALPQGALPCCCKYVMLASGLADELSLIHI